MKSIYDRIEEGQDLQQAIKNSQKMYFKHLEKLQKRIEIIFTYPSCYFLTFTIAPKHYNLNINTYTRKIKQALNTLKIKDYVFNIDYGKENERLHFHAVVGMDENTMLIDLLEIYKYGAINFKPIHTRRAKSIKLYLKKLVNHATKESASKIIFSRNGRSENNYQFDDRIRKAKTQKILDTSYDNNMYDYITGEIKEIPTHLKL